MCIVSLYGYLTYITDYRILPLFIRRNLLIFGDLGYIKVWTIVTIVNYNYKKFTVISFLKKEKKRKGIK